MSETMVDDIVAWLPPLLQSLEALQFIARNLHPPTFDAMMDAVGQPDRALQDVRAKLKDWPESFADLRGQLDAASEATLTAFAGLRAAQLPDGDLPMVFRALRHASRAQEALYATVARLPPVSSFFLTPARREDAALIARLASPPMPNTGVIHDGEPGRRGGFSLYVPEYDTPDEARPLVMALHGGSGSGRSFLWSWLSDARSSGAIVIAPTAIGPTWALRGHDPDTPNLARILAWVQERWNIDPTRLLLTGMSDGGTFCMVTGMSEGSPFTHLAPVSATYHPLLIDLADRAQLPERPIYLTHGRLDWMFPVEVARQAQQRLAIAGAYVSYREIDDLSHCYPREINANLLEWLGCR